MSEMVERLARAIYGKPWSRLTAFGRQEYEAKARAALAELREPTKAMILVGSAVSEAQEDGGVEHDLSVRPIWTAMVDEALG